MKEFDSRLETSWWALRIGLGLGPIIAGADKFVLTMAANSPKAPLATPVLIEGIVNDRADPMELKMMTFSPLQ